MLKTEFKFLEDESDTISYDFAEKPSYVTPDSGQIFVDFFLERNTDFSDTLMGNQLRRQSCGYDKNPDASSLDDLKSVFPDFSSEKIYHRGYEQDIFFLLGLFASSNDN